MSLTMNKRELFGPFAPGGARTGFQYVNEVSGAIEQYRATPLLAISNTLNANGLATSAPKFWGNSCERAGVSPFFPAPSPFYAGLRNTGECCTRFPSARSHAAMLYVIDNEQARTTWSLAPGGTRARISLRHRGFRANRAVLRDATSGEQQHAEFKWVGDKRSKILGKLLETSTGVSPESEGPMA
jgi:hypothetical protein